MRRYGYNRTLGTIFGYHLSCIAAFRRCDNRCRTQRLGNAHRRPSDGFCRRQNIFSRILMGYGIELTFRIYGNTSHRFNRFYRIHAACCFATEHNAVRAVQNGIGNITRFGTGRARVIHHRFQHLRCRNDRFPGLLALTNDHLL